MEAQQHGAPVGKYYHGHYAEMYIVRVCTHSKVCRSHLHNDSPTNLQGLRKYNQEILVSFYHSCLAQATEQRGSRSSTHQCPHPLPVWSGDILTWLGELLILGNAEVVWLPWQLLDEVGRKHSGLPIENTFPPSFFHLHRCKRKNRETGIRSDAAPPSSSPSCVVQSADLTQGEPKDPKLPC